MIKKSDKPAEERDLILSNLIIDSYIKDTHIWKANAPNTKTADSDTWSSVWIP